MYLDSTVTIHMTWYDPRLRWEPAEFSHIRQVKVVPEHEVWVPNLLIGESMVHIVPHIAYNILNTKSLLPLTIDKNLTKIQVNRLQEFSPKDEAPNFATLKNTGELGWHRNFRVRTSCPVNIGNFPYDIQICPLKIASFDNSNDYLRLRTQRWNRLNDVDPNQRFVRPNNTEKFQG